jgi:uncharacterized protein
LKALVGSLATLVRRYPWWVVGVTLLISALAFSGCAQFQPAEDQNESFAPEEPELQALDIAGDLFGADVSQSVMQVIISSDGGDVLTLDGLATVDALRNTVLGGSLAPYLIDQPGTGPVVSYLTPVEFAIANGAPPPTSDAEVKALYTAALNDPNAPPEIGALATGLLPESADRATASSPSGLMLVFTTGPPTTDDFTDFADASSAAGDELTGTEVPAGMVIEPFSFELLFSDNGEFQQEILRLLITAVFIILLVLSVIFLIRPRTARDRWLAIIGFVGMLIAIGVLVVPGLATLWPDLFPESFQDADLGLILGVAAGLYLVIYLAWTFSSRGLRRTTADTLLTIVAIFMALIWMNGYGYVRFGDQSQLVQVLPILLIGLGVDYSIHMGSRYREEMHAGRSVDESTVLAIRTVGIALVLATITTAVGFLTNIFNDLPALREFGELAAVGILASFVIMLTFLPAVRELLDRGGSARETIDRASFEAGSSRRLPRLIGRASWLPKHAAVATLIVSIVLGGLGIWGTLNVDAAFSFIDFIPTTSPLRGTFGTLLDEFGGGFGESTQVLVCDFDDQSEPALCRGSGDVATPDAWNGMVAASNSLTSIDNVVTFGDFAAADSPVSLLIQLTTPGTEMFDPAVAQAAQTAGITQDDPTAGSNADVAAMYDAMFAAAPEGASGVLATDNGSYVAALFTIRTQAGETGAAQLQEDLNTAFEPVSASGLTVITTSDEIISDVIITSLRDSQVQSLVLTLVAALILLIANFWVTARRPMLGVITTLPVILVVLLSFALMTLFGIPFGPVTATISALAVGIGIPYMIHITHRYEEDRIRCFDENEAIESTLIHTGGAMAGSALTTIAGFGILVTSTTIPFRQFGFVTSYTIGLALLAAVLILPSYLVIWDRWHRSRGEEAVDVAAVEHALDLEDLELEPET